MALTRPGKFAYFGIVFAIYLFLAWFFLDPHSVWSPDEGSKLMQLSGLRFEERFRFDIPYGAASIDPGYQFVPFESARGLLRIQDDRIYLRRIPLFTGLTRPLYDWFGNRGLYLLPAAGGALMATLTLLLVKAVNRRPAMWVYAAFGSPILVYSTIYWEHTIAGSLVLIATVLMIHDSSPVNSPSAITRAASAAAILLLMSAAFYLRLETLIYSGALLLGYFIVHRRPFAIILGVLLLPSILLYIYFHQILFGQPVPDNAAYLYRPLAYLSRAGFMAVQDFLLGPYADEGIRPGLLGGIWTLAAILFLSRAFDTHESATWRRVRAFLLVIIIAGSAAFLFTATPYRAAHGLMFTTPWILLALARSRDIWQKGDQSTHVLILTVFIGLVLYGTGLVVLRGGAPHGGLEWGSRFFISFFPLLAILSGWGFSSSQKRHASTLVLAGVFLFLGIGFQIRGLWTIKQDKAIIGDVRDALIQNKTTEHVIVTDLWWLPFSLPDLFVSTPVLVITPGEQEEILQLVDDHEWTRFTLVTLNPRWMAAIGEGATHLPFVVDDREQLGNIKVFHLVRLEPETAATNID